jgi:DNA-binding MarR family transcriptional regulator
LEVARELAAGPAVGGARLNTVSGLKARTEALAQVGRPARMLAEELDALGWASASDQRLLDRMGWTRPRVVQVIAELESRGLVEMREESTGRGRPRKLYRLTPAADFLAPHGIGPAEIGAEEILAGRPSDAAEPS